MPYMVMVRCPNADKAVATGVICDIKAFGELARRARFCCPECGDVHTWSAEDAWLRDREYATGELLLTAADLPG